MRVHHVNQLSPALQLHQEWLSAGRPARDVEKRLLLGNTHWRLGQALLGRDLSYASLAGAALNGADLTDTVLTETNLILTDFTNAQLWGTCLDPKARIPAIADATLIANGLSVAIEDGIEYVYGWRTQHSQTVPAVGNGPRGDYIMYRAGQIYTAPWFSICSVTACHPGIYMAGKDWLCANYVTNTIIVRCRCRRSDLHHVGDKFRCRSLEIVGPIDFI